MSFTLSLRGAVGAGLGAVGSGDLAFGGAPPRVEFGLQGGGAAVGLSGVLGEIGELAASCVQLRADALEFAAKLIGGGLGAVGALMLGLRALAQNVRFAGRSGKAGLGFGECLLGVGTGRVGFGGSERGTITLRSASWRALPAATALFSADRRACSAAVAFASASAVADTAASRSASAASRA